MIMPTFPYASTDITHHDDGSHTVVHAPSDDSEPTSYGVTDLDGVHDGLDQNLPHEQPTEEGALESTEGFRDAARSAWRSAALGILNREAGFVVDKGGTTSHENADWGSALKLKVPRDAFATVHTHPNIKQADPSDVDIEGAKKLNKPQYVVSREGLFMVRPSDGKTIKVFSSLDWMKKK